MWVGEQQLMHGQWRMASQLYEAESGLRQSTVPKQHLEVGQRKYAWEVTREITKQNILKGMQSQQFACCWQIEMVRKLGLSSTQSISGWFMFEQL